MSLLISATKKNQPQHSGIKDFGLLLLVLEVLKELLSLLKEKVYAQMNNIPWRCRGQVWEQWWLQSLSRCLWVCVYGRCGILFVLWCDSKPVMTATSVLSFRVTLYLVDSVKSETDRSVCKSVYRDKSALVICKAENLCCFRWFSWLLRLLRG